MNNAESTKNRSFFFLFIVLEKFLPLDFKRFLFFNPQVIDLDMQKDPISRI